MTPTYRRIASLIPLVVLLSAAFGCAESVLWSSSERTYWVGNMSALWLALAFVAGRWTPHPAWAAVVGWLATVAALAGFYAFQVMHSSGSWMVLQHVVWKYGAGGALAGPLFGWLGHRWRTRRSWYAAAAVVAAFALEPTAWRMYLGFTPSNYSAFSRERIAAVVIGFWFAGQLARLARRRSDAA